MTTTDVKTDEPKDVECPTCYGFGHYQILNRVEVGFGRVCSTCNGTGRVTVGKE